LKKINIGIVAHVDAGKTTVTEHLLYHGGAIKTVGRVDLGNTQTDSLELERRRGISIKSSTTSFPWKDVKINIIDTPGHVDFVSEVERSISILDGAILVISAKEGIQSQTRVLFDTLKALGIPTIIFINKVDRTGCDCSRLLLDLKKTLSPNIVGVQNVYNEGSKGVYLGDLFEESVINNNIVDSLGDIDRAFLENYIENVEITKEAIVDKVSYYAREGRLYPVLYGSALLGLGIKSLLDCIPNFLPHSYGKEEEDLSGVVFKIERQDNNQKKIYIRLFQGQISLRDTIKICNKNIDEKVTKIDALKNGRQVEEEKIVAGDIGIIYGLKNLQIGDVVGTQCDRMKKVSIAMPILKSKISPLYEGDKSKLFKVLTLLSEEDPLLQIETNNIEKEIYISLFGDIQMDVIKSILEEIYDIKVRFSDTMILYKETARGTSESLVFMNRELNPFWATVGLRVEPIKRGEGLKYVSEVSIGSLPKSFQNAIEEGVLTASKQGLLGWEVTDTKVTLIQGEFSSVMSTPADFRNLAPMVFMEALYKAETDLLEPLYRFELKVPKAVGGRAMADLQRMRAIFNEQIVSEKEFQVSGLIPIETSKNYRLIISSYTEGRGVFITRFHEYQIDTLNSGRTRKKTMIDPLNKKEYLMYKLNTIKF